MRKIVLYEFTVSGGLWHTGTIGDAETLVREGQAMLVALAADFSAIDGLRPVVLRDSRLRELSFDGCEICDVRSAAEEKLLLEELSRQGVGIVLIAPESGGLLFERCRWVEEAGGRLIGPSAEIVSIASDKQRMAEFLTKQSVPTPRGVVLRSVDSFPREFPYPAVLKPVDGCGSQDVWLVESDSRHPCPALFQHGERDLQMRLEEFAPGMAASVAVLCGPTETRPLEPCLQRLSDDGRFYYLGGSLPLEPRLAERARNLAVRAVATLSGALGYIGVDLVLGDDPTGAGDTVIEINPRLTTSYIGLRAAARCNLAEAMWAIAEGRSAEVSFGNEQIEFDSDGTVRK
jgi:tyramine---L-glutamate ligase